MTNAMIDILMGYTMLMGLWQWDILMGYGPRSIFSI